MPSACRHISTNRSCRVLAFAFTCRARVRAVSLPTSTVAGGLLSHIDNRKRRVQASPSACKARVQAVTLPNRTAAESMLLHIQKAQLPSACCHSSNIRTARCKPLHQVLPARSHCMLSHHQNAQLPNSCCYTSDNDQLPSAGRLKPTRRTVECMLLYI